MHRVPSLVEAINYHYDHDILHPRASCANPLPFDLYMLIIRLHCKLPLNSSLLQLCGCHHTHPLGHRDCIHNAADE